MIPYTLEMPSPVPLVPLFLKKSSKLSGSTLFPYTTLFRSLPTGFVHVQADEPGHPTERDAHVQLRVVLPLLADRKSTRLNSSHTVISYAVFCLKKKTFGTHG